MILVTGATGFLGAHLCCTLLLKGYRIKALKRDNSSLAEFDFISSLRLGEKKSDMLQNLEWTTGDILDYLSLTEAFEGVKEVMHCAAVVSFWKGMRENMYRVNVEGTANVVNACLEMGVQRLTHVSSIAALGRSGKEEEINEKTTWVDSPLNSNYAKSKMLAEMEVWRGQEEGLEVVIVNPGVVLGEGDWSKGSCRMFRKVLDGMRFYTPGRGGYVDVVDVAEAMLLLSEKGIKGERFVLVGENLDIRHIFDLAAKKLNRQGPTIEVKPWMASLGWRLLSLKALWKREEPLITKETARTAMNRHNYSSEKIKALGLDFTPIEETLDRVISKC